MGEVEEEGEGEVGVGEGDGDRFRCHRHLNQLRYETIGKNNYHLLFILLKNEHFMVLEVRFISVVYRH